MNSISQNYKSGKIKNINSPIPALKGRGVLVKTIFSVVSIGTEGMKVREGKMSLLEKAKARPDQVKKVFQSVQQIGMKATYEKAMNRLDSLTPLGYSLSGTIIEVGKGAEEFTVGQRVACAGAGYANHAEINFIPKNLVVAIPDNVKMEHAAFTTIGAIAMQGYRQSEMQLGETACVIGLGLIGQLLVQILRAAGINIIGFDLSSERCDLAMKLGAKLADIPNSVDLLSNVNAITNGNGVDCVFITAGGDTNKPVELAVEIARDRGRVVDIGKTKLDLPWKDYYEKELDVRFSRSYGPGRYDHNYEEKGIDYPLGYVRWTEKRNMQSFLDLIAKGSLDLDPIISAIYPFDEAEQVYEKIGEGKEKGLGILFSYPEKIEVERIPIVFKKNVEKRKEKREIIRIGVIGAGNYASTMLLPHLVKNQDVSMVEVATATGLSAENTRRKFPFQRVSTDYKAMLNSEDIDAVIIATRHKSHATMVSEALGAKKTVFVEKPLAIDLEGLEDVRKSVVESGNDRLQVGFNRRFSPGIVKIKDLFKNTRKPITICYRIQAGQVESGSWYLDPEEGSRFIGEAGHFFDVFSFLTDARPVSAFACSIRPAKPTPDDLENISVIVDYDDGSVANLVYLTQGGIKLPKEFLEVHGSGRTVQLHNFEYLLIYEGKKRKKVKLGRINKGQNEEMNAFVNAIKNGNDMPIPVQSLFDTALVTIASVDSVKKSSRINIRDYWK